MNRWIRCAMVSAMSLGAALLDVRGADAQQHDVPADVVRALLLPYDGAFPELLVGAAPAIAGVDAEDGRIVGALVRPTGSTVAFARSGDQATLLDAAAARLRQAGWTDPPGGSRGGFMTARVARAGPFCREGDSLQLETRPGAAGETWVIYRLQTPAPGPVCAAPRPAPGIAGLHLLPVLRPPAGAALTTGGFSTQNREIVGTAVITSALSPAELLEHYARQILDQGWALAERYHGTSLAVSVFRGGSAGLEDHAAVLTIVALAGRERTATIRVIAPRDLD